MNSEYGEETKDNPYSTPLSKEISLSEDVSNLKDTMEQIMEEKLQYQMQINELMDAKDQLKNEYDEVMQEHS